PVSCPPSINGVTREAMESSTLSAGRRISGLCIQASMSTGECTAREPEVMTNSCWSLSGGVLMVTEVRSPTKVTKPASTSASNWRVRNSGGPEPTICPSDMKSLYAPVRDSQMKRPLDPNIEAGLSDAEIDHNPTFQGEFADNTAHPNCRANRYSM